MMIETCYRTRDGGVFNRRETAERQERLLDAIEEARAARQRAELQDYLNYCSKHGICPRCSTKNCEGVCNG